MPGSLISMPVVFVPEAGNPVPPATILAAAVPDWMNPFVGGPEVEPGLILFRLLVAFAMGCAVAWVYRRTRKPGAVVGTFPVTLVMLSILIAMVTEVIGDNVARAFSLVGALSIVRFRTVVRDTQDTAFVIMAVAVGMAVGARNPWVGAIGIVVLAAAIALMSRPIFGKADADPRDFVLRIRTGMSDTESLFRSILERHLVRREMIGSETAKQGTAIEFIYEIEMKPDTTADQLVGELSRTAGVQSVECHRRE